jgi:hypothetical protein
MVPRLNVPLFEVLQLALTVTLALIAFGAWREIARKRLLWTWRKESTPTLSQARRRPGMDLLRWLFGCVTAGVILALGWREQPSLALAFERSAYGAFTFFALGLVLAALADRTVKSAPSKGIPFGRPIARGGRRRSPLAAGPVASQIRTF